MRTDFKAIHKVIIQSETGFSHLMGVFISRSKALAFRDQIESGNNGIKLAPTETVIMTTHDPFVQFGGFTN